MHLIGHEPITGTQLGAWTMRRCRGSSISAPNLTFLPMPHYQIWQESGVQEDKSPCLPILNWQSVIIDVPLSPPYPTISGSIEVQSTRRATIFEY